MAVFLFVVSKHVVLLSHTKWSSWLSSHVNKKYLLNFEHFNLMNIPTNQNCFTGWNLLMFNHACHYYIDTQICCKIKMHLKMNSSPTASITILVNSPFVIVTYILTTLVSFSSRLFCLWKGSFLSREDLISNRG